MRRRQAITLIGGAVLLAGEAAYLARRHAGVAAETYAPAAGVAGRSIPAPDAYAPGASYAPDGTAGRAAAMPRADVRLRPGEFRDNEHRNLDYLLFLDPDRMLRSFRLNYGLATRAVPLGGWESPTSRIRGHVTGHLLSALALAYAGTGTTASDPTRQALKAKGDYLVAELGAMQQRAPTVGYGKGYLSGFPEVLLRLPGIGPVRPGLVAVLHDPQVPRRADRPVPAGRQRPGPGGGRAAGRLGRPPHRAAVLRAHAGDLGGRVRRAARGPGQPVRDHRRAALPGDGAAVLARAVPGSPRGGAGPAGGGAVQRVVPKVIAAQRLAEETGDDRHAAVARNFWRISTGASCLRHRRPGQPRALGATGRGRRGAVQLHVRGLRQLQHAQADPAAALPRAGPRRTGRLLRARRCSTTCSAPGPALRARLRLLLHRPVGRRGQAPAAELLPARQPGPVRHRLRHLHLRHRDGAGDAGPLRRGDLRARPRWRPSGEPVHLLGGPRAGPGAAPGQRPAR